MVQEELLVQWENQEKMDKMGKLGSLGFKVFLVGQVQWVRLEIRDLLVIKVLKVLVEYLVHQVHEEIQEKMGILEEQVNLASPVLQEKEAYLEVQGQEVSRVCLVLQAKMA